MRYSNLVALDIKNRVRTVHVRNSDSEDLGGMPHYLSCTVELYAVEILGMRHTSNTSCHKQLKNHIKYSERIFFIEQTPRSLVLLAGFILDPQFWWRNLDILEVIWVKDTACKFPKFVRLLLTKCVSLLQHTSTHTLYLGRKVVTIHSSNNRFMKCK